MERRRFIPTFIAAVFANIMQAGIQQGHHPSHTEQRKCRAFYKMGGYSYPRNGLRECERRRTQIANGSLRAENGLVVSQ